MEYGTLLQFAYSTESPNCQRGYHLCLTRYSPASLSPRTESFYLETVRTEGSFLKLAIYGRDCGLIRASEPLVECILVKIKIVSRVCGSWLNATRI